MTDADLYFEQYARIYSYIQRHMGKPHDIPKLRHTSVQCESHEAVISFPTMCKLLEIDQDEARDILRAMEIINIYRPNTDISGKEILVCSVGLPHRTN